MEFDKKDWERLNQGILLVLAAPYVLIACNYLWPFFGVYGIDGTFPDPDVVNHHIIGPVILVFALPYLLILLFGQSENIFITTKVAVCPTMAVSVLDFFFPIFNKLYVVSVFIVSGLGLFFLFYKPTKKRRVDYGPYLLKLAPKKGRGLPTSSLHENVQIIGGTGTGKTHFVIKPFIEQTVRQDLGCFISDVKGNMLQDVAFYVSQAAGRRLKHFNLINPRQSNDYNPLYGDNADAIANRAFTALFYNAKTTETYYLELADAFLHNLIGLLKEGIETITFQDLLTATQETDSFRTISWFCSRYPQTSYARYFREQWLGKPPKDRRMELTGLINKLQRFCNSEWAYLLNVRKPGIRMRDVVAKGEVFLFSPNFARYPEDAKAFSILAMMDLAEQLADRYATPPEKPFRVFLDEFYNLAYPRFIDFINKCREAQVNLFLAHQSLGDLKGVSPEFQEQVMNTASNKIILRVNDPDTAESFARQFGTVPDKDYRVESFGKQGEILGFSKPPVEKFRFHPNLFKELRAGQAIVKVVADGGVHIFKTDLRAAATAPEGFSPREVLVPWDYREKENESSLPNIPTEPKETAKAGSRMGEDQ